MPDKLPEDLLPLTPAVFHILLALADGAKHGYIIMQEVDEHTKGKIPMGPGTLYGSLKRMMSAGLVEESTQRPAPDEDDPRRRYYQLTRLGRWAVVAEARRLARAVRIARDKALFQR